MTTPIQEQFKLLKSQNSDAILFFQLGDFYEMFYEDAQIVSRVLGLTLTARHKNTDNEMPMCGVPRHASSKYLKKLVENGYRVAIADQTEDDLGRISRNITRVVSPGANVENGLINADENAYLVAVNHTKTQFAIAVGDLSTGDFRTCLLENEIAFFDEIYKLNPREILLSTEDFADESFCQKLPKCLHTPRPKVLEKSATEILTSHFNLQSLDSLGLEKISLLIEVSAFLLKFLQDTQKEKLNHFQNLKRYSTDESMILDRQTATHLEIFYAIDPLEKNGHLLSVFNKPKTAMGGRKIRQVLANPLLKLAKIHERLEAVEELNSNFSLKTDLAENLNSIADLERILARISINRGNARDLLFLKNSLIQFPKLHQICESAKSIKFREKMDIFNKFSDLVEVLEKSLEDEPPIEITEGGMIREGFDKKLDELKILRISAQNWLDNFLEVKKKESGIDKLRIKHSNVCGFCLEVSKSNISKVPESWVRRQTLVNAERFTTSELNEYESKILSAESESFALEHKIFLKIRDQVLSYLSDLQNSAQAIAELDLFLIFAETAERWQWNKPEIRENSELKIKNGRHPVVEKLTDNFISNNLEMNENSLFHLITGPNMAGKSTFLRQNAIIILLAQIGSFVPAESCEMPIFDRIFTRVGASDNLAGGQSTFFVEMNETARILNSATAKSFIILDEIGRGTSTFDGISLAWAITEFLHNKIKAKTIFATHYHEMIECVEELKFAKNFHVSVSKNNKELIFLRKILDGGMSDSFGIEVAKLAGIPYEIVEKSQEILEKLENRENQNPQPNLFNISNKVEPKIREFAENSQVEKMLEKINPNDITPKSALELIYELKKL